MDIPITFESVITTAIGIRVIAHATRMTFREALGKRIIVADVTVVAGFIIKTTVLY